MREMPAHLWFSVCMNYATALDFASDSERSRLRDAHEMLATIVPRAAAGAKIQRASRSLLWLGLVLLAGSAIMVGAAALGASGVPGFAELGIPFGVTSLAIAVLVGFVSDLVNRPVRTAREAFAHALHVVNRHAHRVGREDVRPISIRDLKGNW